MYLHNIGYHTKAGNISYAWLEECKLSGCWPLASKNLPDILHLQTGTIKKCENYICQINTSIFLENTLGN